MPRSQNQNAASCTVIQIVEAICQNRSVTVKKRTLKSGLSQHWLLARAWCLNPFDAAKKRGPLWSELLRRTIHVSIRRVVSTLILIRSTAQQKEGTHLGHQNWFSKLAPTTSKRCLRCSCSKTRIVKRALHASLGTLNSAMALIMIIWTYCARTRELQKQWWCLLG